VKARTTSSATVMAASLLASPAMAQNLEYRNFLPPTHPSNVFALTPMFEEIAEKSGGKLNINLQAGGALAGPKDTLSAIETSLIDGGFIVSIYVPNEIPLNNVMSDMVMVMEDPVTMVGALNETVLLDCPSCLEEYQSHNVTYLGSYATTAYSLMCKEPVQTLADIQGLKIRSSGDAYGRWINEMGGIPVSVATSEAYEALQRGQLDCVFGSIGWLKSLSLWDVSKHALRQEMAGFGGGALVAFNTASWEGLTDEDRAMIIDATPSALARLAVGYVEEDDEAVAEAAEHGVTVYEKDAEIDAPLTEYKKSEIAAAVEKAGERGAEGAQEVADAFVANIAKWKKISEEVGGDVAKVEEALRREIYSKLGN
jgi:TRAP-type C4-dicarboxylate transport system substrate-binding protein